MATNKYWNSDIYVIRTTSKEGGEVSLYVGSTTDFDVRKGSHKSNLYNESGKGYNIKLYSKIRYNSGDWNMEVYKHFRCENQKELEAEEERVRVELNADLNMRSCSTGLNTDDGFQYQKEYNAENKEKKVERAKNYYINNKEKMLEHHRIYNANNKEKIVEYKKNYYAKNKEKLLEYGRIYNAKNK